MVNIANVVLKYRYYLSIVEEARVFIGLKVDKEPSDNNSYQT